MGIARGHVPTRPQGLFYRAAHRGASVTAEIGGGGEGLRGGEGGRGNLRENREDPAPTVGRWRGGH